MLNYIKPCYHIISIVITILDRGIHNRVDNVDVNQKGWVGYAKGKLTSIVNSPRSIVISYSCAKNILGSSKIITFHLIETEPSIKKLSS